jgi:predicted nucleic acid-binding protein
MGLRLSDFPSDTEIYIDANIFLFSAFNHPRFGNACRDFLIRVDEAGTGYVSDLTLNEVFHKLMLAEVSKALGIKSRDALTHIKRDPTIISKLEILWEEMELIRDSRLQIISLGKLFPGFVDASKKYNLLATDAMIVHLMKGSGLENIATNDADFQRVDFLNVWKP